MPPRDARPDDAGQPDTRTRLIRAMALALQQRGYHGIGLTELLDQAGAPKGVLYHHFPGGKQALAVAAVTATAQHIQASLDRLISAGADPLPVLAAWLEMAREQLERSDFERGCPLATVALETTADDQPLRDALASAFAGIRARLARLLAGAGIPAGRAEPLAALVVAAYEGALIQARVARSGEPMHAAAGALLGLLRHELAAVRAAPERPPTTSP